MESICCHACYNIRRSVISFKAPIPDSENNPVFVVHDIWMCIFIDQYTHMTAMNSKAILSRQYAMVYANLWIVYWSLNGSLFLLKCPQPAAFSLASVKTGWLHKNRAAGLCSAPPDGGFHIFYLEGVWMTLSRHCHYSLLFMLDLFILKLCILWQGFFFCVCILLSGHKAHTPIELLAANVCVWWIYVYCTLLLLISVPFRATWGKNVIPDVEPYDA